jgi:ribosomal protein L11 methyltransferase
VAWTEVRISVTRQAAAIAELALEQLGALAVTLEDDADHPVLEPGPGETPLWPTVHVRGLFEAETDRSHVMTLLQAVPGSERPGNIRWREVGDQDWARAWMDRFQPMRFGKNLWIVPTGMDIPQNPRNIKIRLDPGLAFGTGTHPTTALCLEWLDSRDLGGLNVVDYGCGSGILAIAAALKEAKRVDCVDNDPQALDATADNARRNGVGKILNCCAPESFDCRETDIVLANILAGPLIDLAPIIASCVRSGRWIVLSGQLEEQVEQVVSAYEPACAMNEVRVNDGWARVVLQKS